ncbi:LysM peptidoglycan-binding domain-containing protein [Nonomuraea recticatena]|uniref:LysM domain-containing protein n=1 Tax=Nonomuraea recticatena TaxID=46178 RepID=A0ABN3RJC3_9ACTN
MRALMMLGRGLRVLGAGAVLVAIEGGVPYMLVRFAWIPLPSKVPSWAEIERLLVNPISDELLLGVLAVPLWLLWAAFSVALAVEIAGLARGIEIHVPLLGPLQSMAAGLLGSMAIAVLPIDLRAASVPIPPVVVEQAAHARAVLPVADEPRERVHVVRPGESLWKIAGKRLGSGTKWRKLWQLNAHHRQVDGQQFTDPDLIQPGWRLRLPAVLRKSPPTPAVVAEPPKPTAERAQPAAPSATVLVTIDVPSGGVVAMSAIAGMCAAHALARFHRRRRRVPPAATEDITITPGPETPPVIEAARRAFRESFHERDETPPSDLDLIRMTSAIEVPDTVVIGASADGSPLRLPLSGLALGLTGPGADDVVRAVLLDLLHQAGNLRVEVVTCTADATRIGMTHAVPGLTILGSPVAALDRFEEIRFTRRRVLAERDAEHVAELRRSDPGEVLPAVVLVLTPGDDVTSRLPVLLEARCGLGALVLGEWPAGAAYRVEADHRVAAVPGDGIKSFIGASLIRLSSGDLADALRNLGDAQEEEPATHSEVASGEWTHSTPVWVRVLGRPAVWVKGHDRPLRVRGLKLSLLLYLALHPQGAAKEAICEALWSGKPPGHEFHSLLRHLRGVLESASGQNGFVLAMDNETYRVDSGKVGYDLWEFQQAVRDARTAPDVPARIRALERAAELCGGELGSGLTEEWILEEQYPLTLAQVDVLTQLAELVDDPERKVELLDQARRLDPDTEEIWCRMMRLQLSLGLRDRARHTGQLLTAHLRTLQAEPLPATAEVLAAALGLRARSKKPERGRTSG